MTARLRRFLGSGKRPRSFFNKTIDSRAANNATMFMVFLAGSIGSRNDVSGISGEGSPVAGRRVQEVELPEGALIISVLRDGAGFVPKADSVINGGDQVLLILDPGLEGEITPRFSPSETPSSSR